jgi:hypothetical protein
MRAEAGQTSRRRRDACCIAAALAAALCIAAAPGARAQTVAADQSAPPRTYIPDDARAQLAGAKSVKDRVKVSLRLAEGQLQLADGHTVAGRYIEAGNQLGIYQAIVEDLLTNTRRHADAEGKRMRDTFKRIEMSLRSHVPRLETMRRTTPSEEAVHIRTCIEFVRDARTRALESFYDDTVLRLPPDAKQTEAKEAGSAQNGGGSPPREPDRKPTPR